MEVKNSQKIKELSIKECENICGGVFFIPPAVVAIIKGVALIGGSAVAGGAAGYGLYKLFD